ncbi:hypothetical protein CASFOL_001592 [Castilleja foliolosa]|uniref:BHLH domain-containing protein n=1 Tax=Castilleja foliolosa TaxID=1961234 RepID=A0ABD3ELI2_9LAMI
MALSYYSNWAAFQQLDSSDTNQFDQFITVPQTEHFNQNDLFYSPENDPNSSSLLYNELPYDPYNNWDYHNKLCFYDNYAQNPNNFPALPEYPARPTSVKKEGSLSAQSVAARQRRRRITVKTQELGKLVPGGQKMNTAEMLQAAYKYIKFLQAQVDILELAASYHDDQGNGECFESDEELKILLESSVIQEKLCSSEKCLVPEKFVQEISGDIEMLKREH